MIEITTLDLVNKDERGYTYEYFHDRYGRHLTVFRKAGSISGRHYHKGNSLSKNPEIIILIQGNLQLNYREVNSTTLHTVTINEPSHIAILPYIWHELIALTDCAFIELNSLSEHASDTYTE
jgi:dTDP-4-dehydrorhamnose 3,5-epimerase-like enzyme